MAILPHPRVVVFRQPELQEFANSWPRECIVFDGTARIVGDLAMLCMNAGFKRRIG
jgi:hypothetical protein